MKFPEMFSTDERIFPSNGFCIGFFGYWNLKYIIAVVSSIKIIKSFLN